MKDSKRIQETQEVLVNDATFLRGLLKQALQSFIDAEFSEHIGAAPYERTEGRQSYRNGTYERDLKTRVGLIELRVPRDREGNFCTEIFERYQRSEKALVLTIAEAYVQGVSTRKVSTIAEELLGHTISRSQVSDLAKVLDEGLEEWRSRSLEKEYVYVQVDALYQKVREGGCVDSVATLIATGIARDGSREVLGCKMAGSEHEVEWKRFLRDLRARGLKLPSLVISDDHEGLKKAVQEVLTGARWQRCQVHYMRTFTGMLKKKDRPHFIELMRSMLTACDTEQAKAARESLVSELLDRGQDETADWVEETADEALNVLSIPKGHRKRIRSTNMLERLNEEVRRRTRVARIFPSRSSCLRLTTAVCQEISESWGSRHYLNFDNPEEEL